MITPMIRRLTLMLVLWAGMCAAAGAVQIEASLDRDSVQMGETVQLTVEVQSAASAQPDFSILSGDFQLLGTHSSRELSLRDGVRSAKTIWTVELEPRRAGRLVIPALAFGKARTTPLQLQVHPAATSSVRDDAQVFLESEAVPLQPWVQQQVQYTVRLFYRALSDGNLEAPQVDDARVSQVGDDHRYQKTVNGKRWHVLERRYALTPQRSGVLVVAPVRFRGIVPDGQRRGFFATAGRQVSAQAPALTLDVRPRPESWPAGVPWLPARQLQVEERTAPPAQAQVGEPVTRTIRIRAQGVDASQLPEIVLAAADGAQVYTDQEQRLDHDDGHWVIGERARKFAFVPDRPGSLRLPAFSVRWWNVSEARMETASVPEHVVEVVPAVAPANDQMTMNQAAIDAAEPIPQTGVGVEEVRKWQMLAGVAALLWLATMVALLRRRGAAPPDADEPPPADRRPQRKFLLACQRGDWAAAEKALLAWAGSERPGIRSLGQLLPQLDDTRQKSCIARLQHARYGGGSTDDMGAELQRALGSGLRWATAGQDIHSSAVPQLYPHQR